MWQIDSDVEHFVITLPPLPKCFSPNKRPRSRMGHILYRKAVKRYREGVIAAVAACGIQTFPWQYVSVSVYVYFKYNRRRDEDNLVASLKTVYDGIVRSGAVKDDTKQYMKRKWPAMLIDKENPRVMVLVERLE